MKRLLATLLLVATATIAQFWGGGKDARWQTNGVGALAARPATCTANRDVYVCNGAGCGANGEYHYCTSLNTYTVPTNIGVDARWQTNGVGALAARPATCTVNRDVYVCNGAGCGANGEYHYCTSLNTYTVPAGVDARWQTNGVGALATRPATCMANRDVFICNGAGCDINGQAQYCTALNTYTTSSGSVVSITGTANQIAASAPTGAITLSLPAAGVTLPGDTIIGAVARFKFSDTVTSYAALIGQGAATNVHYFANPTAVGGRHYAAAFQLSSGASAAGDKVAVYGAAQSGASTSDVWGGNFLAQHNAGDADVNIQTHEVDMNELDADRTLHIGKLRTGVSINSGGTKHPGAALWINSTSSNNSWREGIHLAGISDIAVDTHTTGTGIGIKVTHVNSANVAAELSFAKARGTPGAETAVGIGDYLAIIRPYAWGTSYQGGGWITLVATENWGAAATGSEWRFATVKSGTTNMTETVTIRDDGGMQLTPAGLAKPGCDAAHRGTFWYVAAAPGTKDDVQVCTKDAANAYAWRTIY